MATVTTNSPDALIVFDQDADDALDYGVNALGIVVREWVRDTYYPAGETVRSAVQPGYEFQCTRSGISATREPVWPSAEGDTVTDGSARWTVQAPSLAALRARITAATWSCEVDDSLVFASQNIYDDAGTQLAAAIISGVQANKLHVVSVKLDFTDGTEKTTTFLLRGIQPQVS